MLPCIKVLPLLLIAAATTRCLGQYEYDYGSYGYGYDDSYGGGDTGEGAAGAEDAFYYDEYGYYGDEDEQYYEYYGYYADDFAGYEDYYSEEYDYFEECFMDANSKPVLSNSTAACDIKIQGVDKQADKLKGGIDGVYQLQSCYNGKALYKREDSPAGEDRVLWYSNTFGDWDISRGTDPSEAEILMYGGEMEHVSVPLWVSTWHLSGDLKTDSSTGEEDYLPIDVKVACADGKVYKQQTSSVQKVGPALTDAEMEAKYAYIYNSYRAGDPSPTVNFTFVVLLVMCGLTIVLAIPYFLLKKKGGKASVSTSFAQMLQQSKKKQSGHIN